MVYVEQFILKGKKYYRLVHTIRKGNKITHRAKYIGKELPKKGRLEQLNLAVLWEWLVLVHLMFYQIKNSELIFKIEKFISLIVL